VAKSSLKYLRGQIPPPLSAERTIGNNPRVRHGLDWRWDILPARFADDDKGMAVGRWTVEHGDIIGEYKANISQILDAPSKISTV
jgi:hypothetical protein